MTPGTLEVIRAHARECAPAECCGLLVWDGHDGATYRPCRNVATHREFEIHPEDWAKAEDTGQIIGIVHSHQDSPEPSSADVMGQLYSGLPWWIVTQDGWKRMPSPSRIEGRPFAWGFQDCYSLIQDRHRELPDFTRERGFEQTGDPYLDHLEAAGWAIVQGDPEPGDVLFFKIRSGSVNHAGVYVGEGQMLHHLPGRLAVREPIGAWVRALSHTVRPK